MTRFLFILACLAGLSGALMAEDAGDTARKASADLSRAAELLMSAESSSDRIAALTTTVRAYEDGLAAMREGLRKAALRERDIRNRLSDEDAELASVLTLLQTASHQTQDKAVIHPGGALDTIRAGTLAAALVPTLQARAKALDDDLNELDALMTLQTAGMETLEAGVAGVRDARLALSDAIANRTNLPERLSTDDAALQALVNSAETLSGFADSLLPTENGIAQLPPRPWPRPVNGDILRGFNEADAAGVRRPGLVFATEAKALVTASAPATVRFAGELPGQGIVAILEPAAGSLVILAGMGLSFVQRGQIVSRNDPIGLMGGRQLGPQENLIETARESGLFGGETLYMEVRQGRLPVDPAAILRLGQD
ncbi:MAG: peptidoglycan DD-metalloendopeptidase family protein [Silicimonas sp.]|nr:peptidoglycan DD-metalloendopeptidase family protein [Silicimonas sp.]